jgi:hypothetical protein
LIALTIQGSIYKSTDHGFRWDKIKETLIKAMKFDNIDSDGNV